MDTGIVISIITSISAIILSLIAIVERRLDKSSARQQREREVEYEKIKEASAAHIKEIADGISAQYQQRVKDLENEVSELKKKVVSIEKELSLAYAEINRLNSIPQIRRAKNENRSNP